MLSIPAGAGALFWLLNMNPSEPPRGVQTLVHFLEEGTGQKWIRGFLVMILLGVGAALYQFNEARNFYAPDAMDLAQLGRNLAAGAGYHTGFIRPLSVHLLQEHAARQGEDPRTVLAGVHPDLENAPVYPLLLAGLFKALPESWWTQLPADQSQFRRRPYAETAISTLNLVLFGAVLMLVWGLGRRLFDPTAGWVAAGLTFGTESLWGFVNSGLPTMLLMGLALVLMHLLVSVEREASAPAPRGGRLALLSAGAGLVVGLMFLTRYSFGWLLIPVGGYLVWRGGGFRGRLVLVMLVITLGLSAPWLVRNWRLSGSPLGTAGFALLSGIESFPGDRLERSQNPQFERTQAAEVGRKLLFNLRTSVRDDVIRLGGNWISVFFLVGLLVPFGNPSLNRLRGFLLGAGAVLLVAQAGGRTWQTTVTGVYTSENLLVILAPLIFVFGTGFLLTLLDQVEWPGPFVRTLALGTVVGVFCLPFLLAILPPREVTLQDPPYRPLVIRAIADYTPPNTLFMSDIPWAMAWYGPRQAVWATLRVAESPEANRANQREDFFVFADARRPVEAVYLSPFWTDQPLRSRFLGDPDFAWGRFYLDVFFRSNLPSNFPLKNVLGGDYLANGHFLLAAKPWWRPGPH